jgi:hypothetical protein
LILSLFFYFYLSNTRASQRVNGKNQFSQAFPAEIYIKWMGLQEETVLSPGEIRHRTAGL